MPRFCWVSSITLLCRTRRNPRPRTQALWIANLPFMLFNKVTFNLLPSGITLSLPLDLLNGFTTFCGIPSRIAHMPEALDRSSDHIHRVSRADTFRQNILHTHGFENCPHWAACNNPRPLRGRLHEYLSRSMSRRDRIVERNIIARDRVHILACFIKRLLYSRRNLARLASAKADLTLPVPHHRECRETKDTPAFDYLGNTVYGDQLFYHSLVVIGHVFTAIP